MKTSVCILGFTISVFSAGIGFAQSPEQRITTHMGSGFGKSYCAPNGFLCVVPTSAKSLNYTFKKSDGTVVKATAAAGPTGWQSGGKPVGCIDTVPALKAPLKGVMVGVCFSAKSNKWMVRMASKVGANARAAEKVQKTFSRWSFYDAK